MQCKNFSLLIDKTFKDFKEFILCNVKILFKDKAPKKKIEVQNLHFNH